MKGSEKQIKWAEDIKAATIEAIEQGINVIQSQMAGHPQTAAVVANLEAQKQALIECESAADIIDCFSGIKASDPVEKRCNAFGAACRARKANNEMQRKLLGQ